MVGEAGERPSPSDCTAEDVMGGLGARSKVGATARLEASWVMEVVLDAVYCGG